MFTFSSSCEESTVLMLLPFHWSCQRCPSPAVQCRSTLSVELWPHGIRITGKVQVQGGAEAKLLCFDMPGGRWECVAPNTFSGDAPLLANVFSIENHLLGVICMCFIYSVGDPCEALSWMHFVTHSHSLLVRGVAGVSECISVHGRSPADYAEKVK